MRLFVVALLTGMVAPILWGAPSAEPEASWKPIDTRELYVRPGSALDFTPFADADPAGSHGRLIVNDRGEAVFASKPDESVRFLSMQLALYDGTLDRFSDSEVAAYADAIARQGYNLVRFHFLDGFITGEKKGLVLKPPPQGYPLPQKPEDIRFDPRALDRAYLLMAELKKRGVYWNIDLMTSFVGYDNGVLREVDKTGPDNTKSRLFVDSAFRANWKAGVTCLLTDVNPYTGLALKDDPALAFVVCLNEQEILFPAHDYGRDFDPVWHAFLQAKYGDYKSLYAAWAGKCGTAALSESGTIEGVPPIGPTALTDTPAGRDMARCCGQMEEEMSCFYLATLKEIGFSGLSSNWNMRTRIGTVPARSLFPVITMNSYHAHPLWSGSSWGNGRVSVPQDSALASGGHSFNNQVLARFLDRPFVNTEFGLVFWNRYRHEQGLLHGAGAAFQGWTGINCHAGPVIESGLPLTWFDAGSDPVIRASEVVEAFAFRRGDVLPSSHTVEIPLTDEFIYAGNAMGAIDDELSRLWAVCRVGIAYGKKRADSPVTLTVSPGKTSSIGGSMWFSAVQNSTSNGRLTAVVEKLRQMGVLAKDNRSDPQNGIFQSDTGQLTLDTASGGEMRVCAPRLEGAVLKGGRAVRLDALTVSACSVPASVTMISLEADKSLRNAGRLLLVFATDARNSNMKFTDDGQGTIWDVGTLPVVARTGRLQVTLQRTTASGSVHGYALRLNGERADEVPVRDDGKSWTLDIDTGGLTQAGPTPFVEIVANGEK